MKGDVIGTFQKVLTQPRQGKIKVFTSVKATVIQDNPCFLLKNGAILQSAGAQDCVFKKSQGSNLFTCMHNIQTSKCDSALLTKMSMSILSRHYFGAHIFEVIWQHI